MKFVKYGKSFQISIGCSADMRDVLELDEALWAVTGAPVDAFNTDPAFLRYLDSDGNSRIRTDEVKTAVAWCLETLSELSGFDACSDSVKVSDINANSPDGPGLIATAEYISGQFPEDSGVVRLDKLRSCMSTLRDKPLNGDGVIVPESAESEEIREYICAAIEGTGGVADISGKTGVGIEQLTVFRDACTAYLRWLDAASPDDPRVFPLGSRTHEAWETLCKNRKMADDFFLLAGLADFDHETSRKYMETREINSPIDAALLAYPPARPLPDGSLPLSGPCVNPVFKDKLACMRDNLVSPALGRHAESISGQEWNSIKAMFAPYNARMEEKTGLQAEKFPREKLEKWIRPEFHDAVAAIVEKDSLITKRAAAFDLMEKLILCQMHMMRFLNNFVCLSELYSVDKRAVFERGSAVLDGRWFNMAVKITDVTQHMNTAKSSGIFIIYLDVFPTGDHPGFKAVLPATSGTKGNLCAGKRGIFIDLDGVEHDAAILNIIENPISLREAVFSPFKNVGDFVIGKIESMSVSAEKKLVATADLVTAPLTPPAAPAPKLAQNNLMGISFSLAAIGSSLAFMTKSIGSMSSGALISGVTGVAAVIIMPIMTVGIIKLKRQDLSPILEGCGWAVNHRMKLTRGLRRQFTSERIYPRDASGTPAKCAKRAFITAAIVTAVLAAAAAAVFACAAAISRMNPLP